MSTIVALSRVGTAALSKRRRIFFPSRLSRNNSNGGSGGSDGNGNASTTLALSTIIASIPLMVFFRDNFFSVARVKGVSMEPSLKDGDILLVRRADFINSTMFAFDDDTSSNSKGGNSTEEEIAEILKQEQIMNNPQSAFAGANESTSFVLYRRPPLALTGHLVVYLSTYQAFPAELCVKRVIGVGSQLVQMKQYYPGDDHSNDVDEDQNEDDDNDEGNNNNKDDSDSNNNDNNKIQENKKEKHKMHHRYGYGGHHHRQPQSGHGYYYPIMKLVPPNALWVEGDNSDNSFDSRDENGHGPISKNLLIGIPEYIIWPPSRWSKLTKLNIPENEKRAFWQS